MEKYYEDLSNLVEGDKRLLNSLEAELKNLQLKRGKMPNEIYDREYQRLFYHLANTKLSLESNERELKRRINPLEPNLEEKISSLKKIYKEERDPEIKRELAVELEKLQNEQKENKPVDAKETKVESKPELENLTEEQIMSEYLKSKEKYKAAVKEYDDIQIKNDSELGYTKTEIDKQVSDYFRRRVESFKKLREATKEVKDKEERYKDVISAHEVKDESIIQYGNIKVRCIPVNNQNNLNNSQKPGAAPMGVPVKKENTSSEIETHKEIPQKIAATIETHPELLEEVHSISIEEILSGRKKENNKPLSYVAENIEATRQFCEELKAGNYNYNIVPNKQERIKISEEDEIQSKISH